MRVLVLGQYFPPEPVKVGDVALGLKELGHDVSVLTGFPNYPYGRLYPGYRLTFLRRDDFHGIPVLRVPLFPDHSYAKAKRLLNYASFVLSGSILGLAVVGRPDRVLVFQTSPISMAVPAVVLKKVRRIPLVLWVQDLWPETLEASGMAIAGATLSLLRGLARAVYRNCDLILTQSPGFIDRIAEYGIPRKRIVYLPNWAEPVYREVRYDPQFAKREGLEGGFNVIFAGNIGLAQNLENVLDAAALVQVHRGIRFVIIGDGAALPALRERARQRGLENVIFKGRRPSEEMPRYFALAGALLVQLKRSPLFSLTVPGKVQAYMASGRPIVGAVEGSTAQIILESGGGVVCHPDDPAGLRDALLRLQGMSSAEREEMGRNARAYYEQNFDRAVLLGKLDALLSAL